MPIYGKVAAVVEEPVGTTLSADVVATATSLPVDDLSQLAWPEGTLQVGDEVIAYTVDGLPDQATDELSDDEATTDLEAGTVTLAVALANDHPQDTQVSMYPDVVERTATVILPGQQEELHLRVPQHLVDRLPTGVRTEPDGDDATSTSETVELEFRDDDWVIVDLVAQAGTGQSRGYQPKSAITVVTASGHDEAPPANPDVVCSMRIIVPSVKHRIIVSYAAEMGASSGTVFLGFDDAGQDFTEALQLAQTSSSTTRLALPLLPDLAADSESIQVVEPPNPNTGFAGDTAVLGNAHMHSQATVYMPYTTYGPTVGEHLYRLVAWTDGSGSVGNANLWITVI